jgi:hypothetical protein
MVHENSKWPTPMRLDTYEDAVAQAKLALKISDSEFEKQPVEESETIVNQIEERFVDGHQWLWWWEHLLQVDFAARHREDRGFLWLHQMLPESEPIVWFVVEPFGEKNQFSLYETQAKHIQPILEECICFEYYVVAKDLSWLMGENHHGCFFCVGEPVTTRLKHIVEQNPEQWMQAS